MSGWCGDCCGHCLSTPQLIICSYFCQQYILVLYMKCCTFDLWILPYSLCCHVTLMLSTWDLLSICVGESYTALPYKRNSNNRWSLKWTNHNTSLYMTTLTTNSRGLNEGEKHAFKARTSDSAVFMLFLCVYVVFVCLCCFCMMHNFEKDKDRKIKLPCNTVYGMSFSIRIFHQTIQYTLRF